MSERPVVLVALGCFWPGNDASGPNQSFIALATALRGEFEFRVIARDRAPGAAASSAPAGWVDLGFAEARYLDIGRFGARGLAALIRQTPHDALWLNSVYDREFTLPALLAARFAGASKAPVVLSPRGEFGAGALEVKAAKKQVFLRLARTFGLWRGITWHATSEVEANDISAGAPRAAKIVVARNLRLMLAPPPFTPPGEALRVIFVGRIAPIKGLAFALKVLAQVRAKLRFEILGPAEDQATYAEARGLADKLPPHIEVVWRGAASNQEIVAAHARSDLFLLPTGGENFGHAIFEALSCGVPALISDQTPWRGLTPKRAGWDLPLADPPAFVAAIETYAATPAQARAEWREGARACARAYVDESGAAAASARLLREAMGVNRIAVVVSHPIQYYAPLWRALAREPGLDLKVFFATRVGLDKTYDVEMRTELAWATDLTAGYAHEFLPEAAAFQRTGFHVDNPGVGAALSRFAPDALVLHGYGSKTLLRALVWSKLHRARALLVADSSGDLAAPGWRRRFKRRVLPYLLRRYDAALTMGDRGEDHLASLGFPRARMFRTPTMMDEMFWKARRERARLRAEKRAALGLGEDDFVVLAAAKLAPRKRIGDLIAAARGLNATLLIAGEGEQRAALEAQAAQSGVDARFLGFVNIDALPALYAAADVFAHPAEREPYGMVAVEAAIVGLPLLVSDDMGAVGPGAIARPCVNALTYAVGDLAALAGHSARLREDEGLRARLAAGSLLLSRDHDGKTSVAAVLAAAGFKKATAEDLPRG